MIMATYQTQGIIIGRTNFGEADRIIRFITPDRGKVSAVAKGVRRIKSRSGGHVEPLGEVALTLATGRNLDVMTGARLLWYPHQMAGDYDRLGLAFMAASMVDRLVEEDHPHPGIYELTGEMLKGLEAGSRGAVAELWFKLRLLILLGYRPELSQCLACGQNGSDIEYYFSAERGGITCDTCHESTASSMCHAAIKLWRIYSDHSLEVASAVSGSEKLSFDSLIACDGFYEYHLGRTFSANPIGLVI